MCLKSPGTDVGAAGFEKVSQDFWDTFYIFTNMQKNWENILFWDAKVDKICYILEKTQNYI